MRKKILAITVGGSIQPVVRVIGDRSPDMTLFFVTDQPHGGSRKRVLEKVDGTESLVVQVGLQESNYELVILDQPDDLPHCYQQMREAMARLENTDSDGECIADYTGGTKTMSAALVLAALALRWGLSLVQGKRSDLAKAINGTELSQLVQVEILRLDETLNRAATLFNLRHYDAVESLLRDAVKGMYLPEDWRARVQQALSLACAFSAWDRFAHQEALDLLRPMKEHSHTYMASLSALLGRGQNTGFEQVFDLVRNAERKSETGQYDVAVLLLYRAVELLAQIHLRQAHSLETGDLDLTKIPESFRSELAAQQEQRKSKITVGLVNSYRLLSALDDPLGRLYCEKWEEKVHQLLDLRNHSILAHGENPIGKGEWDRAQRIANAFLAKATTVLHAEASWPQFPLWEDVMEKS